MKNCTLNKSRHNLNIQMYSFQELLQLFELTVPNEITENDLKRAKLIVLKTHPDKSRLPPEYFIFYKKAFEIIVEFYNTQQRTMKCVPKTEIKYSNDSDSYSNSKNDSIDIKVSNSINSMKPKQFQKTFNELFEKNNMGRQIVNKNTWFSDDAQQIDIENIKSVSSMNQTFEKIKEKQQGMIVYNGIREIPFTSSISCGNLYDDIEDEIQDNNIYIESDPFSRLKFEDIKRVHKNETVFTVGEKDYNNIPKFSSVEQYSLSRKQDDTTPLYDDEINKRILIEKEIEFQNKMLLKEYELKKKILINENKNKSILSYFLQIE